jgi:hypothetical protein
MGSPLFVPGSYAGTIYRYRGSRVATQFLSFAFVPLVPVRGSLHIADDEVVFLRRPFRLMPLSVVAAYLRVWPMLAVLLTVASGWGRWAWLRALDGGLGFIVAAAALSCAGFVLGTWTPRAHRDHIDALLRGETHKP